MSAEVPSIDESLGSGPTVETHAPAVVEFTKIHANGATCDIARAVKVYYAVRDKIRYDPYSAVLTERGLSATKTLETARGWCVSKAILLAACYRSLGIPARLGFADVRNHLSTEKMRAQMETDVFFWHGYTAAYLEGRWVKSTPAFNIELCERFALKPLDFNGREDSIYHPYDLAGNRHMEYLNFRGEFVEPPIEDIARTFAEHYPGWPERADGPPTTSTFDEDVERETRG